MTTSLKKLDVMVQGGEHNILLANIVFTFAYEVITRLSWLIWLGFKWFMACVLNWQCFIYT